MPRDKAINYQEVLEKLEARLRELKREQSIWGDWWVIHHQIEAIEKQIAAIKEEIFYDAHPNLKRYKHYIRVAPQIAASVLLLVSILWANMLVRTSGNVSLEMLYEVFSVASAAIVLYFAARYYSEARKAHINELKRQIALEYPKPFLEIENSISLLTDEA